MKKMNELVSTGRKIKLSDERKVQRVYTVCCHFSKIEKLTKQCFKLFIES